MGVENNGSDRTEGVNDWGIGEGARYDTKRSDYETTKGVGHFTGPNIAGELAGDDVGVATADMYWTSEGVALGLAVTAADSETGAGALIVLEPEQAEQLAEDLTERAETVREAASEG